MSINTLRNHGMTTVLTKDPLSLSYRLTMGGYSVDIFHKVGQSVTEVIISGLQTIRPGFFLSIISHNSKSKNHNMRSTIIISTYVYLEVLGMIF